MSRLICKISIRACQLVDILADEKYISYDVVSGSEIKTCNRIYKPLVDYLFSGRP